MAKLELIYDSEKPAENSGWGDSPYSQGYNFEVYRIWELKDETTKPRRYFKQHGTGDSYGDVQWSTDDMLEVEQIEKVVSVYEYK